MEYRVEQRPAQIQGNSYWGYIDNEYAGYVFGYWNANGTYNITHSKLAPKFQGTKAVRALSEIIKAVEKDYRIIRTRIDNKDNAEIKMILSVGFKIIGTVTHGSEIAVELLKIREG